MRRRTFIATATAATASLAGCSILGGDDGGGPQQAVRDAASAIEAGDMDALRAAYHPDSPNRPSEGDSMENANYTDVTIESMETVEQSDGNATVEATVSSTVEYEIQGETQTESMTNTLQYDVRQHEGEWLLYSSTTVSQGDGSA